MTEKSIARTAYDLSMENRSGSGESVAIVLPKGVAGRFFTIYFQDKPYQNAMVFSDGSELTIDMDGVIFWSDVGEWSTGNHKGFEVPVLPPEA